MDPQKTEIARFFDKDSAEYLKHKYTKGGNSYMALRRVKAAELLARFVAPGFATNFRFLDCGCGPGILLDVLARYPIRYSGVDISIEMLKLAARQPEDGRCELLEKNLLRCDVERLPFASGTFDAAASLGVIEYLNGDDRLVSEMARVVRPGGHVLIAVTNRASYNLLFERPLNWMRRNRATVWLLNRAKLALGLGEFRRAEFDKRRHLPRAFLATLRGHQLEVVASASWGFNFLPHPFQHLCAGRLNDAANAAYERSRSEFVRGLGEGYMVLCRKAGAPGSSA